MLVNALECTSDITSSITGFRCDGSTPSNVSSKVRIALVKGLQ
jgi:hypothetical protein